VTFGPWALAGLHFALFAIAAGVASCAGHGPNDEPAQAKPGPGAAAPPAIQSPAKPDDARDDQDDQVIESPPPGASCGEPARCYQQGLAAERVQPARAAEDFAAACEGGLAQGCHRLGQLYARGRGVARDDARAKQLAQRACELGSTAACDALGH
jgi:TPR repeat protein